MRKMILIYIVLLGVMGSGLSPAQEKPLKLTGLIDDAFARNPKIKSVEQETRAYLFRVKPAQTLPDPMIEFGLKNMGLSEWMIGQDPSSGIAFSFSQMFPFFGKLKLAGDMARKAYEGRQQALESAKLDIAKQVKTAYFDLYYLYKAIDIAVKQKDLTQKVLALTETRYAVGSGIQGDIFKAQLEISRMDEMIIPMKEMIKMKEASINFLLDYPPGRPLGKPEDIGFDTVPVSLEQLEENVLNLSPRIKEARAMEEEKSIMVKYSLKEFKPDLNVKAAWEYKGKLPAMYELMLGMEIPLYAHRKQANRLKEAKAMAESARMDTTSMKNDMQTELYDYFLKAKTSENLIRLYKTRILPQARLALEASFSAYPVNRTDFMSLLTDISNQFSAELAYYRELSQLWSALAALESLTATPLLPTKE